jgi:hypothetical protein
MAVTHPASTWKATKHRDRRPGRKLHVLDRAAVTDGRAAARGGPYA